MIKGNFTAESIKGDKGSILSIKPQSNVDISTYQSEMIVQNKPKCLCNYTVESSNDDRILNYHLSSYIALEEYLRQGGICGKEVLSIVNQIVKGIIDVGKYYLAPMNLIFDQGYIFIEPSTRKVEPVVYLIYVPLEIKQGYCGIEPEYGVFFLNIIASALANGMENDNQIAQMLKFLLSNTFQLKKFSLLLQSNCESETLAEAVEISRDSEEKSVSQKKVYSKVKSFFSGCSIRLYEIISKLRVNPKKQKKPREKQKTKRKIRIVELKKLCLLQLIMLFVYFISIKVMERLSIDFKQLKVLMGVVLLIYDVNCIRGNVEMGVEENENVAIFNESDSLLIYEDDRTVLLAGKTQYPRLINVKTEEVYSIDKNHYLIGRDMENVDLYIEDKAVGRVHAIIKKDENQFYLKDLNSKNHTYHNGVLLSDDTMKLLFTGDRIKIGSIEYKYFE